MSCLLQRISSPALLLVCLYLFPLAPLALFAQPPKATGSVAGRITDGEKPIPGITVTARDSTVNSSGQSDLRGRSVTDGDGRYRISDLSPGRYRIVPQHALYVVNETAASRSAPGSGLNLAEGESVENTDFGLTKGGVIAGRITDHDGKPAIEQQVGLMRMQPNGKWQQFSLRNRRIANTDDRGDYRLYGLEAGKYKVYVGRAANDGNICLGCGNNFRRRIYYPNATDEATAQVVEVKAGEVSDGIDIRLQGLFKTQDVIARVLDAQTGQPVAGVMCGYGRWNKELKHLMGFTSGPTTATNGEVTFNGVGLGTYGAFVNDGGGVYSEISIFEVTENDAPNIEVRLQRGKSVSGQMVLLGSTEASRLLLRQTSFEAFVATTNSSNIGPAGHTFTPNADLAFSVSGLPPGEVNISVAYSNRESGLRVMAMEHQGVKKPNGIPLTQQADLAGVRVYVLTPGGSTLRGGVQAVNGTLPVGTSFRLQLIPKNIAWLTALGESVNVIPDGARTDQRGQFEFTRIYPGEYELLVNYGDTPLVRDASGNLVALPTLPPIKQVVHINEGSNQITVRLDLAAPGKEGQ